MCHCDFPGRSEGNKINPNIFGPLSFLLDHLSRLRQAFACQRSKLIPLPFCRSLDGKRERTETPAKCPLADTHMNSSEKLQFYKEKAPDCHGPLLKREAVSSQESKQSKKRAFEEPEKEQSSSSQSSKQKYVCLSVEDWDLLNSC